VHVQLDAIVVLVPSHAALGVARVYAHCRCSSLHDALGCTSAVDGHEPVPLLHAAAALAASAAASTTAPSTAPGPVDLTASP
jgi:hypothetical protein